MATGHYSCSSNSAKIADENAVNAVLSKYDTHNQVSVDATHITVESPSDSMNVTVDGQGAVVPFLKELGPHLATQLRVTNVLEPPREQTQIFTLIASPDGTVVRSQQGQPTVLSF